MSLSSPSPQDLTLSFDTEDGTALFMRDYLRPEGRGGALTIPAGHLGATITFDCPDDRVGDGDADQFFFVRVTLNATSLNARVTITP